MFGPSMGFIHVSSSFIFQYLQVISPSAFCGFRTGLQKYRMVQASFRFSESGNLAFEDCCNILGTLGDVFVVFPGAEPDVLKKASDRSRVTWLDESKQIPLTSSMSIFINLLCLFSRFVFSWRLHSRFYFPVFDARWTWNAAFQAILPLLNAEPSLPKPWFVTEDQKQGVQMGSNGFKVWSSNESFAMDQPCIQLINSARSDVWWCLRPPRYNCFSSICCTFVYCQICQLLEPFALAWLFHNMTGFGFAFAGSMEAFLWPRCSCGQGEVQDYPIQKSDCLQLSCMWSWNSSCHFCKVATACAAALTSYDAHHKA